MFETEVVLTKKERLFINRVVMNTSLIESQMLCSYKRVPLQLITFIINICKSSVCESVLMNKGDGNGNIDGF